MSIRPKKILLILISLFLALSLIAFMVFSSFYNTKLSFKKDAVLYVEKGASLNDIIKDLETNFNFDSGFKLKLVMEILSSGNKIKPGNHALGEVLSIKDLIEELKLPAPQIKITLLEGWKISEIAAYLNETMEFIDFNKFIDLSKNPSFIEKKLSNHLGFSISNLEGYLYPETYYVDPQLTEEDLIVLFVDEFISQTKKYKDKMSKETMIVASIIEAETNLINEMDTISSVYNNRINQGMKLDSDPTILYYMSDEDLKTYKQLGYPKSLKIFYKYKYDGSICPQLLEDPPYERKDLMECPLRDHPYNTYNPKYGIPPGPINSPGINAIEAAIEPAKTNYIYMVMNDKLGRHLFAVDTKGHKKNKDKN